MRPNEVRAYVRIDDLNVPIEPARVARDWMRPSDVFARQCLPLRMANQHGWFLINPHSFIAIWDGGSDHSSTELRFLEGAPPYVATSHFGHGIVSFIIPYLFRTAPEVGLLFRGPANFWIEGAAPLEGLVETDWAVGPAAMSWKLTRMNEPVYFEAGKPFCMVVPIALNLAESLHPSVRPLEEDPDLTRDHRTYMERNRTHMARVLRGDLESRVEGRYFAGVTMDDEPVDYHRSRLRLRPFTRGPEVSHATQDWLGSALPRPGELDVDGVHPSAAQTSS